MTSPKSTTAVDPMEDYAEPPTSEEPPFAMDEDYPPFDTGEPEEAPPPPRTRKRPSPRQTPEPTAVRRAAPPAPLDPSDPPPPPPENRPARPEIQSAGGRLQNYADQGMEGLEVTYGAYPIIRLINEGIFETHEGEPLGKEFLCILQASKPKFIYKATGTAKDDEKFAYTFDHEYTASGEPLREVLESWADQGYGHEVKKYLDVLAVMMGEREGEEVLLSVPKTSIGRLTRYLGTLERKHGCPFNRCITRVLCAEKVTKTKHAFYPWGFEFHEKI